MNTTTGQRAAWDAYFALIEGLLPALGNGDDDRVVNPRLGGVVIRIRRYAPVWEHDGPTCRKVVQDPDGLPEVGQAVLLR